MNRDWIRTAKPIFETALEIWTRVPQSQAWKQLMASGIVERLPHARTAVLAALSRRGVTPWGALAGAFAAGAFVGASGALLLAPGDGAATRTGLKKWFDRQLARIEPDGAAHQPVNGAQKNHKGRVESLRTDGETV